jgi:hypothetical protein
MKGSVLVLMLLVACGRQNLDLGPATGDAGSYAGTAGSAADASGIPTGAAGSSKTDSGGVESGVDVFSDGGANDSPSPSVDSGADAVTPRDAGSVPFRAVLVTAGSSHTCALLDDHNLKCWGDNGYGALGTGDSKNRGVVVGDMGNSLPTVNLGTGRTAKIVSAGRYATCAILDDDTVKCWGWITQAWGSEHATTGGASYAIGDQASEMGDGLPRIDLGSGRKARLLAVGYNNTCVVRDDEGVRCWGAGAPVRDYPQVTGKRIASLVGADGVLAVYEDGTVSAIAGAAPSPPPTSGLKVVAVAGSLVRSCILWNDGTVTGINAWSQKDGLELAKLALTQLGWPCSVYRDGSVTCPLSNGVAPWIGPDVGHGPTVRTGHPVTSIAAGLYHFCGVLADGSVKCWTTEDHSVLGLGNSYPTPTSWPSIDLGDRAGP